MLCNAVEGQDDDFNEWYTGIHLREILETDGFSTGQRFKLVSNARMTGDSPDAPFQYLTLYEVEDVERADAAIYHRARTERDAALGDGRTPPLQVSPSMDRNMRTWWFESISDLESGTA